MEVTKNKAWSVVISIILLILFNIAAFALPVIHGIPFWLGYSFGIFAIIFLLCVSIFLFNGKYLDDTFKRMPVLSVAWIYFVIQMILSFRQMSEMFMPYYTALIYDVVLAAIASIILIFTLAARREIERVEVETAKKVFYIRNLKTDLELLETDDKALSSEIKKLAEMVRFSDPMSHSQLSNLEDRIEIKYEIIRDNLDNISIAMAACQDLKRLLDERNKKCKMLKNVPEPKTKEDNSGMGILVTTFGIISFFVLVALTITFICVPISKYNQAISLYDSQQYTESAMMFSSLGNYRDSKDRLEQIYNKLDTNNTIYFGEYNGSPVAWKILKTEKSRMLLITEEPIKQVAFNNELENITYKESTIRKWLNDEFIEEFSRDQKKRMLKLEENLKDGIFLLSKSDYEEYKDTIDFKTTSDWWLKTKTPAGMMFVDGNTCEVNTYGESVVRAIGVRPCVWVDLIR